MHTFKLPKPFTWRSQPHLALEQSMIEWLSFTDIFRCTARVVLQGPSQHSKGLQQTCDGLRAGEGAEGVGDGVDILGVDV